MWLILEGSVVNRQYSMTDEHGRKALTVAVLRAFQSRWLCSKGRRYIMSSITPTEDAARNNSPIVPYTRARLRNEEGQQPKCGAERQLTCLWVTTEDLHSYSITRTWQCRIEVYWSRRRIWFRTRMMTEWAARNTLARCAVVSWTWLMTSSSVVLTWWEWWCSDDYVEHTRIEIHHYISSIWNFRFIYVELNEIMGNWLYRFP